MPIYKIKNDKVSTKLPEKVITYNIFQLKQYYNSLLYESSDYWNTLKYSNCVLFLGVQ